MNYKTLSELQQKLRNKEFSCIELVEYYLGRIEQYRHLNAFLEVFAGDSCNSAAVIDAKLKDGTAGKLSGLIIGIKDNICYKGHKVSASSKILESFESLYSSTAVERLLREDAIIIGRLNCDEFAMGSSNEYSAYGAVKNPIDESKVPGGSSGGCAAAVAAGLCHAALGSDTGGSIRQPASLCGIVGFKPTYGTVSRYGLIAFSSSFDQIGPLTKSVEDTELIYSIIRGKDGYDSGLCRKKLTKIPQKRDEKATYKIAYLKDCLENDALDPEIKEVTHVFIEKLKRKGHTLKSADLPLLDYLIPIYYILTTAEASSNLARYDGIHYGYRSFNAYDLESTYKLSRTEGFGPEVKRRILLGTFVLSSGFYDAYYGKAQKARQLIKKTTDLLFSDFDFILSPTTPGTAFDREMEVKEPTQLYLQDIFTVQANICGLPAISIPLGEHSNGLPFGMQLMAPPFEDAKLLAFASLITNKREFRPIAETF